MLDDALFFLEYSGPYGKPNLKLMHECLDAVNSRTEFQLLLYRSIRLEFPDMLLSSFTSDGVLCAIKGGEGCRVPMRSPDRLSVLTWFTVKREFSGQRCPLELGYYREMPQRILFNFYSSYYNF